MARTLSGSAPHSGGLRPRALRLIKTCVRAGGAPKARGQARRSLQTINRACRPVLRSKFPNYFEENGKKPRSFFEARLDSLYRDIFRLEFAETNSPIRPRRHQPVCALRGLRT